MSIKKQKNVCVCVFSFFFFFFFFFGSARTENQSQRPAPPNKQPHHPTPHLDADRLVDGDRAAEALVAEHERVLGQQREALHVARPDCVLNRRRRQLREHGPLLHVEERDAVLRAQEQQPRAGVEDGVRGRQRGGDLFRDVAAQVAHDDRVGRLVERGEAVARDEDRGGAGAALGLGRGGVGAGRARVALARERVELVRAAFHVRLHEDRVLGGVVRERARALVVRGRRVAARRRERRVALRRAVVRAHVPVFKIINGRARGRVRGPLALELEDDHARVVPGREQVDRGVRGEHPEAVVLAAEGLHADALGHVPHAERLVLAVGDDEVGLGVEEHARDVVHVPAERVDLPGLGLGHAPELDLPVVGARDDERQRRVEGRPVDAAVVALEHVLDDRVAAAEEVGAAASGAAALAVAVAAARAAHAHPAAAADAHPRRPRALLAEARDVPHAHGLVERGGDDQVLARVELRAHHVVVVPRQHRRARARLPVPEADRLVVRGGDDPGVLRVELDGADIIQVAEEREEAAARGVRPYLDLVVVAARGEERLRRVEVDTADGALVLVEAFDERAHAVVPELRGVVVGVEVVGWVVS
jgi:hypothetical protein